MINFPSSITTLRRVLNVLIGIACLVPALAEAQSCVRPPTGLVSWWRGEGSAKDTLKGNTGVASSGTRYVAGKVGRAFAFDGLNDVVLVADAPSLGFASTSSFTIELWAYRISSTSTMHLMGKRQGCGGPPFYGVAIGPGAFPSTSFPLNTWTHTAVTYNGDTGMQEGYLNGSLVVPAAIASGFIGLNNAPLMLGSMGSCAGFDGYIDEVSLYRRTLSADELRSIVAAGTAGKCDPTPICDIQLNRGTFLNGDQIVARVARLGNPGPSPQPVEVKLWFEQPDGVTTVPVLTAGADSSFVLSSGFDNDYAPLGLATVQTSTPRGTHRLNCRVLNPATGETLSEDSKPFQVE